MQPQQPGTPPISAAIPHHAEAPPTAFTLTHYAQPPVYSHSGTAPPAPDQTRIMDLAFSLFCSSERCKNPRITRFDLTTAWSTLARNKKVLEDWKSIALTELNTLGWGIHPDDARDTPFKPGVFFDDHIQVHKICNALIFYRFEKLGQLAGPICILEFLIRAPRYAKYIGGTQQLVSMHARESLRAQWRYKHDIPGRISRDIKEEDATEVRLEAMTLVEFRASLETMRAVERELLKRFTDHPIGRKFAKQFYNCEAHSKQKWEPFRTFRIYMAMFFVTDDMEPSPRKQCHDASQQKKFELDLLAMEKGEMFQDMKKVIEEFEDRVGRKVNF